MNEPVSYIVSTRIDPDMMRELRLAQGDRPRGVAIRELLHSALVNRHRFEPLRTRCRLCFMPEAHTNHWSDEEIRQYARVDKELGIGAPAR